MGKHTSVTGTKAGPIYSGHYDPADLAKIIDTQHAVTNYLKKQKMVLIQIIVIKKGGACLI